MKKLIALLLACVMVLGLVACGNDAPETTDPVAGGETTPAGPTAITLKVWAPQEDQVNEDSWLIKMEKAFQEAHPEYVITWDNGVCAEGDAKTLVTTDITAAADVFMFANDQLGDLVNAKALAKLGGSYLEQVQNDVSATYLNSVTHTDGGVYGFPVAPNCWFMYYNKSMLTEEDVKSLEACLAKGPVAFETTNSWYLPAFFFANGCTLFGEAGNDASAGVQFGGELGTQAMARVIDLVNNNANFINGGDGKGNAGLKDGSVAAYFSGSWDYAGLYEALGEDLGAVAPPTVEINGEAKQMMAYAGSKAVGVNPNSKNMKAALEFAAFLASADSQLARFELRNITPAVTRLTENENVAASIVAIAEMDTMANASVLQPTIPEMGNCWTPVADMGTNIINGTVTAENVADMVEAMNNQLNDSGL